MAHPFRFDRDLAAVDPEMAALVGFEEQRQERKIILIASESLCPRPVREVLASGFGNLYAEGYPSTRMLRDEAHLAEDHDRHLAFNRRYADRRYYKGCEYVNFVEVLAARRAAELFARTAEGGIRPSDIHVNVQPLSGSAANNAIYTAFVRPGATVMGMALPHGGHLTHGSSLNRSGIFFRIVPYELDPRTGRLDYDRIRDQAREHQPEMIIAGGSACPFDIDWAALREAAAEVRGGCTLLADISHPAGLVAAGLLRNPVGIADVVSLTTHKTLCGPRGAIILTTDPERARRIDLAVFPGEQGGPHVNQIAAKATAFRLAATPEFRNLMAAVKGHARTLAEELVSRGFTVATGGTETHLLLLDLREIPGRKGPPLKGDIAANILDLAGITCNKNTIPGDRSAAHPSAIRLGATIIAQMGFGEPEVRRLAGLIARTLASTETFEVHGGSGLLGRGKIPLAALDGVRAEVAEMMGGPPPHAPGDNGASPHADPVCLEIRGERAIDFLRQAATSDVAALTEGACQDTRFLDGEGHTLARAVLARLATSPEGHHGFALATTASTARTLETWLRGLSDGYILFDPDDVLRKINGPVSVVRHSLETLAPRFPSRSAFDQFRLRRIPTADAPEMLCLAKPWFIGGAAVRTRGHHAPARERFEFTPADGPLLRTPLHAEHLALTDRKNLLPFAGHEMPILYESIAAEHRAVRTAAGLFDIAHMGVIEVSGDDACRFLDILMTNYVPRIRPGQSQYTYLLDPAGRVMDDLLIYQRSPDRYMVVANAANQDRVLAWLRAAAARTVILDEARPEVDVGGGVTIRDLKHPEAGADRLIDLGFQGPVSRDVLLRLAADPASRTALSALRKSEIADATLAGIPVVVSRTGYTGEETGYELFVHPDEAVRLWRAILEAGAPDGVRPAGLGARDSTRTEAGFPLFGHELAGDHDLDPIEAGYGAFVKFHKPFFVGREALRRRLGSSRRRILRFRMMRTGIRVIHPGDPIVNGKGQVSGFVTSACVVDGRQMGLAIADRALDRPGQRIGVFVRGRDRDTAGFRDVAALRLGDRVPLHEEAEVIPRFRRPGEEAGQTGAS